MVSWIKRNRLYLLLLASLVLLSYANSLPNGFVSDDRGVVSNAHSFSYAFSEPLTSLRPFLNFIAYSLVGLHPFVFRLINILFHIGTVWLIFALVARLSNRTVAFITTSLFAVHPILVESITWISGGVYVQYGFFFLLTFLLYIRSEDRKNLYIASVVVFILSLLSSQNAVVLPLIFPLYEFAFGDLKKNWKKTMPFFVISGLYTTLYFSELGQRVETLASPGYAGEKVFYNPLLQIPVAITSYFELLIWPDMLTLYHSETIYTVMQYIIRLTVLIIALGGVIFSLRYTRAIFFWFIFFLITLIPTLNPFGLTWIVAERYVYLGSLGVFVVLAFFLAKVYRIEKFRLVFYILFALVILALSIRSIVRNVDWYNEDSLWLSAARTSPNSAQNHNNLGDLYGRRGDRERSVAEFQKAIELKPNYADAYHNLGNAYVEMGKINEAIESYKKAISFNPGLIQSYQNLAAIYANEKNFDLAEEYAKKAIAVNPKDPNLLVNLGIVYVQAGKKDEAKEQILKALTLDPQNQRANEVLKLIEQ